MDFSELLNIAASNQAVSQTKATVKRYSTTFSAPKRCPKSEVRTAAVQKFLAKKKQEEEQSVLAEQRKKDELLALRSQNTKPGKKAKMVASRTKDNNSNQINGTGGKLEANRDVESPRTPVGGGAELAKTNIKAAPQPTPMNYEDLLQLASQKQNKPLKHIASKAANRPMTEKQKAVLKEQARAQKSLERESGSSSQPINTQIHSSRVSATQSDKFGHTGKHLEQYKSNVHNNRQDQEVHTARDRNQVVSQTSREGFRLPKKPGSEKHPSHIMKTEISARSRNLSGISNAKVSSENKSVKNYNPQNQTPQGKNTSGSFSPNCKVRNETQKASPFARAQVAAPKGVCKRVEERRNIIPKSVNSKPVNTVATSSGNMKTSTGMTPQQRNFSGMVDLNNRIPSVNSEAMKRPTVSSVKISGSNEGKRSESKTFHMNPYMDEPLQLLEPQNSRKKQMKHRLDSDDDEDDDMSDFIDDEPSQGEINYSKYIKEIFRCDRSKFVDDDDDDIMETSYAEQMKEEKKSAKLGYLEDLEDIMKEKEEKKRKMLKKKRP